MAPAGPLVTQLFGFRHPAGLLAGRKHRFSSTSRDVPCPGRTRKPARDQIGGERSVRNDRTSTKIADGITRV
jgi:hypothetical protein